MVTRSSTAAPAAPGTPGTRPAAGPIDPPWLDDTEQLAWRGLMDFVLRGLPRIERTFREHGLVHLEYAILVVLSEAPDGLRLSMLAHRLGVSPSRLTHRMSKLLERELVVQRPCERDGRGTVASITDAGAKVLDRVAPEHVVDVRATVFDRLDPEATAALARAMTAIAQGLADDCDAAAARAARRDLAGLAASR